MMRRAVRLQRLQAVYPAPAAAMAPPLDFSALTRKEQFALDRLLAILEPTTRRGAPDLAALTEAERACLDALLDRMA